MLFLEKKKVLSFRNFKCRMGRWRVSSLP